jgi:hypothetical protein
MMIRKVDEPEEEEVNPDFDSFDGLKPSHMATGTCWRLVLLYKGS